MTQTNLLLNLLLKQTNKPENKSSTVRGATSLGVVVFFVTAFWVMFPHACIYLPKFNIDL